MAVFYRTNAQSRAIEEALLKYNIPYRIYGGLKFYERKEVKDILAYLKLIANERDSQSFLRALNTPPRGIGNVTIDKITRKATIDDTSLWQAAYDLRLENPKLKAFVELIEELKTLSKEYNLGRLISEIVNKTGYVDRIKASNEIGSDSRIENIKELIAIGDASTKTGETPESALQTFLDKISLTSGDEVVEEKNGNKKSEQQNKDNQAVSLMTLHLAKGLEFPIVFFTGLEEGLLPHYRSINSEVEIAEERRLCYVGITRARQTLYITQALTRGMFSAGGMGAASSRYRETSRFFHDIPEHFLDNRSPDVTTQKKSTNSPYSNSNKYGGEKKHWERDDYSSVYQEHGGWPKKSNSSKTKIITDPRILKSKYKMPPPMPEKDTMPKTMLMKKLANSVSVADDTLHDIPVDAPLLKDHLDKVTTGLKVLHANFGKGTIINIDAPASNDPDKTKIKIMFDSQPKEKTLLLGKARLVIAE